MHENVLSVIEKYHKRIEEERNTFKQRNPEDKQMHRANRDNGSDQRMYSVGPQTGQLLNSLVCSLDAPKILEIGTSFGYSGIWLAEAARKVNGKVTTLELHAYKSAFAKEMAEEAGLSDFIDFKVGNAVDLIGQLEGKFDFILLDLWKDMYVPCLEAFYDKLNPGAIIVADNMIRPGTEEIREYGRAVRSKPYMCSVQLPVGTGLEISRYEPVSPY